MSFCGQVSCQVTEKQVQMLEHELGLAIGVKKVTLAACDILEVKNTLLKAEKTRLDSTNRHLREEVSAAWGEIKFYRAEVMRLETENEKLEEIVSVTNLTIPIEELILEPKSHEMASHEAAKELGYH